MSFALTTGEFAAIEKEFCRDFREEVASRTDFLREQHLVVVPSGALRRHLLKLLFESGCQSFSAVRIVSFNGLAQEILLDSLQEPYVALDDPIYFVLALQSTAHRSGLKQFQAYRTTRGLLSTIRDCVDGLLTPELLEEFLDQEPGNDQGNIKTLRQLHQLYRRFLQNLQDFHVVNTQYAAVYALDYANQWLDEKNIRSLQIYGFYDATPAQFELLDTLTRDIHKKDFSVRMYFPFRTSSNTVEHPAQYSTEFLNTAASLAYSLGGKVVELEKGQGIATDFFANTAEHLASRETRAVQIFNAGSPYEEAWVVAKKILQLVLQEGVRFDQIGVITRSLEPCRAAFHHVFEENQIVHSLQKNETLCSSTAGHFAYLLLLTQQSHLNHNLVFEVLCSPLLKNPFTPAGMIRELLEILFITNSDDWHRLKPITDPQKKLPDIFELADDDPRVEQFRRAAVYLLQLKEQLDQIPMHGNLSDFTKALWNLTIDMSHPEKLQEANGIELELLLERMGTLPLENEYSLNEFVEIFKDYLESTTSGKQVHSGIGVTIGDIMSLRGVSFDYVFVTGLNHDVWPIRTSEDPFLPDSFRRAIRSTTGAGPHPKRSPEGTSDEELLLFTLALRSAKKQLYLSYQRADSDGRTKSPSIYIQEAQRLTNAREEKFPRHLEQRLSNEFLPAPFECSTLVRRYSPYETLRNFHSLSTDFVDHAFEFANKLNTMDRDQAGPIDGILADTEDLWKVLYDSELSFSYSRIKEYVRCGFSFYADRILKLQPSPFKPTEIPHDLTPLVRGRIAESVVKEAVLKLRGGQTSIDEAVQYAESKMRRKYSSYLPKVLLDYYLLQFSQAASVLLKYLQQEGYDFYYAEVPDRSYMPRIKLLDDPAGILNIYGIPDLLFYGTKKLIGEMKWGSAITAQTAEIMFNQGEFQFCFYPELERQHRQLLEAADFRYFRLNMFHELGSPKDLKHKLETLGFPGSLDVLLRIFGFAPNSQEVANSYEVLKDIGKEILHGNFRILEDPNDYWSPCTNCSFILMCRRTHSATLLRARDRVMEGQV